MANSCKDCKHDKGKCVGVSRAGSHRYCFEKKEMINADRIRAMSDEELAGWLAKTQIANVEEALNIAHIPWEQQPNLQELTAKDCLDWLKQPAEEERT